MSLSEILERINPLKNESKNNPKTNTNYLSLLNYDKEIFENENSSINFNLLENKFL